MARQRAVRRDRSPTFHNLGSWGTRAAGTLGTAGLATRRLRGYIRTRTRTVWRVLIATDVHSSLSPASRSKHERTPIQVMAPRPRSVPDIHVAEVLDASDRRALRSGTDPRCPRSAEMEQQRPSVGARWVTD